VGVAGGTRIGELVNMSVDDVENRTNVLVVQIPDSKTYKKRVFLLSTAVIRYMLLMFTVNM